MDAEKVNLSVYFLLVGIQSIKLCTKPIVKKINGTTGNNQGTKVYLEKQPLKQYLCVYVYLCMYMFMWP